jgi:RecB family endonuclease NucS
MGQLSEWYTTIMVVVYTLTELPLTGEKIMKKHTIINPSEHQIQKEIIQYLNAKCLFNWRNNVGRKHNLYFGLKGSADILGLTKEGIFFAIEVKDYKGKQSEEQIRFADIIQRNNGIYILARSLNDVIKIL